MKKLMTGLLLTTLFGAAAVLPAALPGDSERVLAQGQPAEQLPVAQEEQEQQPAAEEEQAQGQQSEEQATPQEEQQPAAEEEQAQTQDDTVAYRYVAQPGDSYTLMVRKAVQTFGLKYDVQLSLAGILFAETNLTQEAGSPQLEVGQNVEIDEAAVEQWVDRAQELTDEQEAAWNYYVQFADFNTDDVGESS